MAVDITVKTVAARHYVGVRRIVKHDGLGALCGEVLPRLSAWLAERGVSAQGAPALVYHSVNTQKGDFDVQPVLFVAEPLAGEADIEPGQTAGGEVLFACHVGPYHEIGKAWSAVFGRAEAMGRPVTKSSWELYVDDPGKVSEAKLRTEIYVPIDSP